MGVAVTSGRGWAWTRHSARHYFLIVQMLKTKVSWLTKREGKKEKL